MKNNKEELIRLVCKREPQVITSFLELEQELSIRLGLGIVCMFVWRLK